jgi:glycosyltransferase involved in cell wall biosynthesis
VIVPTYGRAPALFEDALRSIFEQTYRNLEVLVVDDSPDPVEISDDPPVPIRRIRNEHDGVASARNSGIETADGELLAFIDDDDRWRSQKVERQVAAFRKSGPDVGGGRCHYRPPPRARQLRVLDADDSGRSSCTDRWAR